MDNSTKKCESERDAGEIGSGSLKSDIHEFGVFTPLQSSPNGSKKEKGARKSSLSEDFFLSDMSDD